MSNYDYLSIVRMYGETDAEMRKRMEAIEHRRGLRKFLRKLGIKSAGPEFASGVITVDGMTVTFFGTGYMIDTSKPIAPIDILGCFEVVEDDT